MPTLDWIGKANLIFHRITDHGRKQIRRAAELLFAGAAARRMETTFEMTFELAEQDYAPYRRYTEDPCSFASEEPRGSRL